VWKDAQARAVRTMGPESRSILDGLLVQAEKLGAL
jgi:hypothetical protein